MRARRLFSTFTIQGTTFSHRSIYLDMQATTPIDPRVVDKMMPYYLEQFGNSHSRTHLYGWETEEAVEHSRTQIADLLSADPREIVFTSGATESNNIGIKGIAEFYSSKGKKHIITTQTEHKCVLDSCRWLQQRGYEISYLPVQKDGLIDMTELEQAITPSTSLVSVMAINNEIGVIQPLKEIGEMCRRKGVFFHTDAAQAFGKIPIDVNNLKIDCMSISGHKIYGPKGIGALYVRRKPRVRLSPLLSGGGQERNIRSGTLAVPLIVGLGEAARLAKEEMEEDTNHIKMCYSRFLTKIKKECSHIYINGSETERYFGNLNISFAGVEGEALIMALKDIAVSSGSACTSASLEPSYVLRAIGIGDDLAHTSLRFGIGRFTTIREIDQAAKLVVEKVQQLREMSPLWDLIQEGVDLSSIKWTH